MFFLLAYRMVKEREMWPNFQLQSPILKQSNIIWNLKDALWAWMIARVPALFPFQSWYGLIPSTPRNSRYKISSWKKQAG